MLHKRELCPGQVRLEVLIPSFSSSWLLPDLIKIKPKWQDQGVLTFTLQILSRYLALAMPPPAAARTRPIQQANSSKSHTTLVLL